MLSSFTKFLHRTYHPLNRIEISKHALLNNYRYLSSVNSDISIAPVLKSNAYGHGLVPVAKILEEVNAPFYCVDSIYEAYELLKAGIKTKILIMGYIDPENLKVKKLPFSYAVYTTEQLRVINEYQPGAGIHIKFDSGMHRLGVTLDQLPDFFETLKLCNFVTIEGFMSHLADSENPKSSLTGLQFDNCQKALAILEANNIYPKWKHLGNSGAILNQKLLGLDKFSNVARTGIALYGIDPRSQNTPKLKPVLRLTSQIVQIKQLKKGNRVGYNGTYIADKTTTIGILPLGYYDGVDRRLSNLGCMLVDNVICPIIGQVSMNITVIDITGVTNPEIGQEVLVYSNQPKDPNSIKAAADICKTIPYDILVHLAASTRREIV